MYTKKLTSLLLCLLCLLPAVGQEEQSHYKMMLAYGLRRGEGEQRVFYIGKQNGTTYLKFMAPQP